MDPCSVKIASGTLFDVVVMAGGAGTRLLPLTAGGNPKALVTFCNRPLIWYTIHPWVAAGCRQFTVCCPATTRESLELFLSACRDFNGVDFVFVDVAAADDDAPRGSSMTDGSESAASRGDGGCTGDSANALRRFLAHRRQTKAAARDVLVLSCDTILAGAVDLSAFIRGFYNSYASASMLFYEPLDLKGADVQSQTDCVAIETSPEELAGSGIRHGRAHFVCPTSALEDGKLTLQAGFLARRPQLIFTSKNVDAHVYLLRSWVLELLDLHRTIDSVKLDLLPKLASAQLPRVNAHDCSVRLPNDKLGMQQPLPQHWALKPGDRVTGSGRQGAAPCHTYDVSDFNSMQEAAPPAWDDLRVFATIYRSTRDSHIVRVNTLAAYRAATNYALVGMSAAAAPAITQLVAPYLKHETAVALSAAADGDVPRVKNSGLLSLPAASAKVFDSVVGRNVTIQDGATVRASVLMDGCHVGKNVVVEGVVLCANGSVSEDATDCAITENGEQTDLRK
jgi:NDP-sugar pyrophosphorylase family protein